MDTFDCEEGRSQGNSPFTSSAELPLGINLRRFPHLTCSTLYRWIRLISNCKDYFELRPIHVKLVAGMFLEFVEKPSKLPALKEDSLKSPPPGDYAAFYCDPSVHYSWVITSLDLHGAVPLVYMVGETTKAKELDNMSPTIEASLPHHGRNVPEFKIESGIVEENGILINQNLVTAFQRYDFGIDVDDNYRIVRFTDKEPIEVPSHVPEAQAQHFDSTSDEFFRRHFEWCLRVHITGGHVQDDFDRGEIYRTMRQLGLDGDGSDDDDPPPPDDPRWQTEIGQLCFQMYMESQLTDSVDFDEDDGMFDPEAQTQSP
ncbi:hypothetical protein SISSUDRAFT_1059931 [Sistotremastrum suecicum HHB10207 ss-3]|uniref:HNH nuclease domain-containing protein n=1 Tax=Sistotremastrum suecicum HHB10207 ss-3 TaxID=1314776 RepID=A0A166FQ25_9AGAM|nr:hypothetical protein SISSUDRAFT_1059931 [Sistotremastrum suecicum HHB10207 ss-3]